MKLALGTAQFGLDYGVSNQDGQVPITEVSAILEQAQILGIDTLDTAAAYGNSEMALGQLPNSHQFNITTKIPRLSADTHSILPFVEQSLATLKTKQVHSLLFHHADDLITHQNAKYFFDELISLKEQGKVQHIGASLYHPNQWYQLKSDTPLDILQVPVNCLDQRFLSPELLTDFYRNSVKLHCRSLFLQGLLLMAEKQWPTYFIPYRKSLIAFHQLANKYKCSLLTLAFAVLTEKFSSTQTTQAIDKIVVGCCSTVQLIEICESFKQSQQLTIDTAELAALASTDQNLINPSLWELK